MNEFEKLTGVDNVTLAITNESTRLKVPENIKKVFEEESRSNLLPAEIERNSQRLPKISSKGRVS